jgi:hypothetical protein
VNYVVHPLITPINVELWMHLQTDWINLHLGSMKDLKDLEGVIEVEVDCRIPAETPIDLEF